MRLFNTLSRGMEPFTPLTDNKVRIYVCGITPYDTTHLGHAFTYITFDALVRYLTFSGFTVDYTQNVTDIDDDILKRAREQQKDWIELGEYWTKRFLADMEALNVRPPEHYVKATESMNKIIEIVEGLIKKQYAYIREGNVYFNTVKFLSYGQLSKLSVPQMLLISRERGADPDDPLKINPLDFILWKKSAPEEPFWDSPWSRGRPGWHIECSAMIHQYLGEQIDIHGGGRDLMYPHHESERAQSESFSGKVPFVKVWMHTAMLMYNGEKMSKSLGNLVMAADLLKKYHPDMIRFALLNHHYRTPWEFYDDEMEQAKQSVNLLIDVLKGLPSGKIAVDENGYISRFREKMGDDLNTPAALEIVTGIARKLKTETDKKRKEEMVYSLQIILKTLGFILNY